MYIKDSKHPTHLIFVIKQLPPYLNVAPFVTLSSVADTVEPDGTI
jgi:hypothetical protein